MKPHSGNAHELWKGESAKPNNKRARAQRLYPDIGICERCNAKPAIHRHHIDENPGNNARANLLFLCGKCHSAEHRDQMLERAQARRITAPRPCPVCQQMRSGYFTTGRCARCYRFKQRNGRDWTPDVGAPATHCRHGHELTPENKHIKISKDGYQRWVCRKCAALWMQAKRERLKAAKA